MKKTGSSSGLVGVKSHSSLQQEVGGSTFIPDLLVGCVCVCEQFSEENGGSRADRAVETWWFTPLE